MEKKRNDGEREGWKKRDGRERERQIEKRETDKKDRDYRERDGWKNRGDRERQTDTDKERQRQI